MVKSISTRRRFKIRPAHRAVEVQAEQAVREESVSDFLGALDELNSRLDVGLVFSEAATSA